MCWLRTQLHQTATVQSLLKMGEWRPKHVEALTLNKQTKKNVPSLCWFISVPLGRVNKTPCHILSDACTQCGTIAQYHIRVWTQNKPKVTYRIGHMQNWAILSLLKDWRKSKLYTSFSSCLCKEHNSSVYNASLHLHTVPAFAVHTCCPETMRIEVHILLYTTDLLGAT
jgi:hypothetical protein